MAENFFVNIVGYLLGILIILYTAFACSAPFKQLLHLAINSVLGCICLSLANIIFVSHGLSVGINPITAVCVGVLGLPGTIAAIIIAFFI